MLLHSSIYIIHHAPSLRPLTDMSCHILTDDLTYPEIIHQSFIHFCPWPPLSINLQLDVDRSINQSSILPHHVLYFHPFIHIQSNMLCMTARLPPDLLITLKHFICDYYVCIFGRELNFHKSKSVPSKHGVNQKSNTCAEKF
jgi:hypothetical protein